MNRINNINLFPFATFLPSLPPLLPQPNLPLIRDLPQQPSALGFFRHFSFKLGFQIGFWG